MEISIGKGRDGSDDRVNRETVGNSLGRVPWGGGETEVWTSWADGKPWEIAWGELRWEEATY